jgi:hypothetical protein
MGGVNDDVRRLIGDLRLAQCPAALIEICARLRLLGAFEHEEPKTLV